MHPLEIRLLGPTTVRKNGELVSIRRRLPRGLLFYLAAQGNMLPRDTILDMFWGGKISQNRPRLNENLSRLRAALPDADIIISYDGLIGLNFEKVFVDLLHFQDLLDQAGRTPWQIPEDEPLPNHISSLLNEANDLWRGPCALEGISFPTTKLDDWLQATTDHLHNARFNILTRLSNHAYVLQDLSESLDLARTALSYDNFNAEYQYKVMRNLIKLGQIQEARQYFEDTQQMMREELGVNPSPKMIHLYQSVRNQEQSVQSYIEPKWEIHPSVDVPFVGRKNALIEINRAVDEKQGIVILGESGQGKSRLVQEYISQLHPQPRVLITICRPSESSLPFHPIVELFRRYISPDEWLSLPSIWANYLTGVLPEITQMRSDLVPVQMPDDTAQTRAMIFESIRQVLYLWPKSIRFSW
jgi:DNA-binding SARP family transcriptional activator